MYKKISKAIAASLMAATLVAPSMASVAPMSASAGQVLGETSFDYKALPWHTAESSPARQNFLIEDGAFHITILTSVGADKSKWDLQFRHRNLNFKAGHVYEVSFQAKASRKGMELCSQIGNTVGDMEYFVLNGTSGEMQMGPHMGGRWGGAAELSTSYKTFSGTFTPTQDLEDVEWTFHYANDSNGYGGNAQDGDEIWFDNMSIICTTCPDDYASGTCNADPLLSYGATNRDFGAIQNADEMLDDGEMLNYISVNQLGYYTALDKVATFGDNSGDMLYNSSTIELTEDTYDFELVDAKTDEVVYTGTSGKKFKDYDSDDNVCKLDFSEYTVPGEYYLRIAGEKWRSFNFIISDDIYEDKSHNMLTNALNYFYQNRSGIDIEETYITSGNKSTLAHIGSHKKDNAVVQTQWYNDYSDPSDARETYASSEITASGGWYDAGDHGKYVVSGGIAVWTLQNMYERAIQTEEGVAKFADGSGTVVVPEAGNGVPDVLDEAAYELDWMAQMKVDESEPTWGKFAGLYYHKLQDYKETELCIYPFEYDVEWDIPRIVKPPTFAATLNYAACAAQAARLWAPYDSEKAENYLNSAVEAYDAFWMHWYPYDYSPTTHPDYRMDCPKEELVKDSLYAPMWQAKGGAAYSDDDVMDDAYWAACEIFVSASRMGESDIAAEYKEILSESDYAFDVSARLNRGLSIDGEYTAFKWEETASAGSLTLALHSDLLSGAEAKMVNKSIIETAQEYICTEDEQGYGIPYKYDSPGYNDPINLETSVIIKGYECGSNSMVINNAIVMAYAYDITKDVKYLNGVSQAMNYLLGNNPLSFSYITGYGSYAVQNPCHKYWTNEISRINPSAPDGVLSGGPSTDLWDSYVRALGFVPGNADNVSQRCYVDSVEAWSTNEAALQWNAPLAWVVSFMQDEAPEAGSAVPINPFIVHGDANCDGDVNMADAVLIMQSIANPDSYKISEEGKLNGDVDENGNGITNKDALRIQLYMLGLVDSL